MSRAVQDAENRYVTQSQQWVLRRFAGVLPQHIGAAVQFVSLTGLAPPPGFEAVWKSLRSEDDATFGGLMTENIPAMEAILFVGDPLRRSENFRLYQVLQALEDTFADRQPALFWIPNTVAPGRRIIASPRIRAMQECGLEDFTKTEATGSRLALDIRMMLYRTRHYTRNFKDYLQRREAMEQQKRKFKALIHSARWEYLSQRVGEGAIPRLDRNLPSGIPQQLFGWTLGHRLGTGACGSVYLLTQPPSENSPEGARKVVKAMPKADVATVADMKCLKRSIEIMVQLSSPQWRHPNIVRLSRVFHSWSHMFFVMQYAGSQNLFRRLSAREQGADDASRLSPGGVCSIINQAVLAVTHMHLGPGICHRDLKPENFIFSETGGEDMRVMLAEFDLAAMMNTMCMTACGSMPFVAPEVIREKRYAGGPADIWSLSVVLLEVLCGTRVLEHYLELNIGGDGKRDETVGRIVAFFRMAGSTVAILEDRVRPELAELMPLFAEVLPKMQKVNPAHRLTARGLREALEPAKP
mmetsp:Transcript_91948/g.256168  ORF Transcript_91948/g.256168 Transcript_91948/m.256168 type:complete len:525 (-) Transcript_91948:124-1698(-)